MKGSCLFLLLALLCFSYTHGVGHYVDEDGEDIEDIEEPPPHPEDEVPYEWDPHDFPDDHFEHHIDHPHQHEEKSFVAHLMDSSFDYMLNIMEDEERLLVNFYTPWCGFCKQLIPVWEELAASFLHSEVIVAQVDATENSEVAHRCGVDSFPTIKMFTKDKVYTYKGERTMGELMHWATIDWRDEEGAPFAFKTDAVSHVPPVKPHEFNDFVFSAIPHLCVFYIPWHDVSRRLVATIEETVEHAMEINYMKVDLIDYPELAARYQVDTPPFVLYYREDHYYKYPNPKEANVQKLVEFINEGFLKETAHEIPEEGAHGENAPDYSQYAPDEDDHEYHEPPASWVEAEHRWIKKQWEQELEAERQRQLKYETPHGEYLKHIEGNELPVYMEKTPEALKVYLITPKGSYFSIDEAKDRKYTVKHTPIEFEEYEDIVENTLRYTEYQIIIPEHYAILPVHELLAQLGAGLAKPNPGLPHHDKEGLLHDMPDPDEGGGSGADDKPFTILTFPKVKSSPEDEF